MCSAVKCRSCGKTTWAGCGAHVDQVMAGVPKKDRCTCDRSASSKKQGSSAGGGVLASLFSRGGKS